MNFLQLIVVGKKSTQQCRQNTHTQYLWFANLFCKYSDVYVGVTSEIVNQNNIHLQDNQ